MAMLLYQKALMTRRTATPAKLALKRGRPSSTEVALIEQAILGTARGMFLVDGFDGVSMEKVAAATGITRTTLYARYATKADLFRAVVRETLARWYAVSRVKSTHGVTDLKEVLHLRVADMASLLVDPLFRGLHSLILLNRHRFPDLAPLMHELGYLNAVRLLAEDIRAAAHRDAIPVERPEAVAEHILTSVYGWFLQYDLVRELSAKDIETHGKKIVDLILLAREQW